MTVSSIEWTQMTWNPTTGCSKISQGCKNCYAETMSHRLQAMGISKYKDGFTKVTEHADSLKIPYHWRKPKIIFVNSMSDLFHESISEDFIQKVFQVMNDNPGHIFQVLTKRAERLKSLDKKLSWSKNIWMGVSVENKATTTRISLLRRTSAKTKFLSCEPLLEAIPKMKLSGIDWVIVGGESGHNPREMKKEWVLDIKSQCKRANIAFFFKQWGGKNKKKNGRALSGRIYNQMPKITNCNDVSELPLDMAGHG